MHNANHRDLLLGNFQLSFSESKLQKIVGTFEKIAEFSGMKYLKESLDWINKSLIRR